jgi:hypothetical protein
MRFSMAVVVTTRRAAIGSHSTSYKIGPSPGPGPATYRASRIITGGANFQLEMALWRLDAGFDSELSVGCADGW